MRSFALLLLSLAPTLVGCAESRAFEATDASNTTDASSTTDASDATDATNTTDASNAADATDTTDATEQCAGDGESCQTELNNDGVLTSGTCCAGRQTCFPSSGDGSRGLCAYVAPADVCAPSDGQCVVELVEGEPGRGNCCNTRQRCFPTDDSDTGLCAY